MRKPEAVLLSNPKATARTTLSATAPNAVAQVEHPGSQGIGVSLPLFIAKDFLQAGCAFRGLSQVANEAGIGGGACV
jgi:hypothetical protein